MGDGGEGLRRVWREVEIVLQVVVRAGEGPPRRAGVFFVVVSPLEVPLWPVLPGALWALTFERDKLGWLEVERQPAGSGPPKTKHESTGYLEVLAEPR